jgi:predicted nucleotidyltransferase
MEITMSRGARKLDTQTLQRVFSAYPDILAVYLFGSTASRRSRRDSDIDLAIVPRNRSVKAKKLDILTDLSRIGYCDVDLLFLDTDDIVLKFEAVRENRLLYQVKDFDRGGMYSRVVREYLDFIPYLEVQRRAYKRRIMSDQA